MAGSLDFDFVDDDSGGRFVPIGGGVAPLRQLLSRGEVDAAVRLYEDAESAARQPLIEEAQAASFETRKQIALLFVKARDFAAAAQVYRFAKMEAEAAACFEQAGDYPAAASSYTRSGDILKAAAAFERAGQAERAIELFREAGATERLAECLARNNRFLEAANLFRQLKKTHAEVETLRAGLTAEPDSLDLVARYSELMVVHGRKEQAVNLMIAAAKRVQAARDHAPFLTVLASAMEATNNAGAAKIRARLQELPKDNRPAAAPGAAPVPPAPPSPAAASGPASEPGADAYGFLKALPMFADLALPDMKALYRICALQTFAPGMHVIEPGQPGKGLFVIVEGQVEVFGGAGPQARLLNTLGTGAYVGEISLLQDGPTSARVTARTAVKALFISRDAFLHYLYSSPQAALRIYRLFTLNLADRVRALSAAK